MLSPTFIRVWTTTKRTAQRLKHPVITSEHLFYACLRLCERTGWDRLRDIPVTSAQVPSHLKEHPPFIEEIVDFCGLRLGISAKTALDRVEAYAGEKTGKPNETAFLVHTLLTEENGPVRALLAKFKAGALS